MLRKLVFTGILLFFCSLTSATAGMSFLKLFIPKTHPSCTKAAPPYDKNFCSAFKSTATCACSSSGMPRSQCQDMKKLHERMLMVFDTVQKACEYQHDTSKAECMDGWKCYLSGGKDSQGRLCQASGKACEAA